MPGLPPSFMVGKCFNQICKANYCRHSALFFAVETRVFFTTRPLLPAAKKDVLPSHHQNNTIYQFLYYCDRMQLMQCKLGKYVGRISQSLQERIEQQAPRSIRNDHSFKYRSNYSRA